MIEVEEPPLPPPRAVRRTYGKPKQPPVVDDVAVSSSLSAVPDTSTDPINQDNDNDERENLALSHSHHALSSPLETDHDLTTVAATVPGLAAGGISWDGLKKGKHADWRKEIADSDHSDDDGEVLAGGSVRAGKGGEAGEVNAYERAKALLQSTTGRTDTATQVNEDEDKDSARPSIAAEEAASSSLPPLTSDDPLSLPLSNNTFEARQRIQQEEDGEEETAPIRDRKRVVKPSTNLSPSSSSSSSSSSAISKTPTRTHVRRRSHDEQEQPMTTTSELPSSQPEYQRQLDLAREKGERKRLRRERAAAAAEAVGNSGEEEEDEEDRDGLGEEGLQTSPASPTMRRGASGRRRRVVAASDEDEDSDAAAGSRAGSTPVPARKETTTTETATTRKPKKRVAIVDSSPIQSAGGPLNEGEEEDDDEDGGFSKTLTNIFAKSAKRSRAPGSPRENAVEREQQPTAEEHQAETEQDLESPTTTRTTRRKGKGRGSRSKAVLSGSEGSSADDNAEGRKKTRMKGLSKKDKDLMNKEAAQMRAGKEVHLSRVRKEFTIASFITGSIPSLAPKFPFKPISQVSGVPPLVPPRSEIPTQSSAVVPTPDSDIGQYSSQREQQQGYRRSSDPELAEPMAGDQTPTKMAPFHVTTLGKGKLADAGVVIVGSGLGSDDSDSDDDDGLGALKKMEMRAREKQELAKRQQAFEEKQKMLKARKEAALKAQQQQETRTGTAVQGKVGIQNASRPSLKARPDSFLKGARVKQPNQGINIDSDSSDNDDDLVILDKPGAKAVSAKAKVERLNPREMLDVKREGANGAGKPRTGGLRFAARPDVMTESMFLHAGQTFDQAGKRQREGKTKSNADTKLSRITDQQSLAFLLERQKKMAAAEREKKERESGLKIRALQPRTQQLIDEETLEETRKAEEQRMAIGMDVDEAGGSGDEDDSEDSDFAPADEEEAEDANEDELLVEETQGQDEDQHAMATPEEEDGAVNPLLTSAMGAVDPIDQETAEEALRQRKRKRLAVVDSDDEPEAAARSATHSSLTRPIEAGSEGVPESSLVSRKVSDISDPVGASFAPGGFDNFGDGFGDSGGLSQFFNATQAPGTRFGSTTQINATGKGLDVLRQGTPAAVYLPGFIVPVVSASAMARDMAIMAAEYNDDHTGYTPRPQKKQYLNSQGLFTQTTPKMNALQGQDSMMSVEEESLPILRDDLVASSEELEPTYQSNGAHRATSKGFLEEASTPVAPLSRLKRRRYQDEEDTDAAEASLPVDSETDMPQPGAVDEDEDIVFPSSQPEQPLPAEAKKLDVLERMMAAARSPPRAEKQRRFPGLAKEFFENEAELDLEEDNGFFSKLDDEDEDAEGDGVVENLVDDTERSKAQELKDAERRAEIDREYAEQEDARRQKIAQEVVDGKHKGRRRDGLDGVLSSDDEDDEDKRKAKRRWPQGETQAFVQAYQGGLASDDSDDDMDADQSQPMPEGEQGKDDDEAEDAPTIRNSKPMAIREIEDQVRRLARQTREREEALEVGFVTSQHRLDTANMPLQDEPIDIENTKMVYVDSDTDQEESQITISRRRDDQRSFRQDSGNKDSKYERWAATADTTDSRRVGANSSVMGGGNSSLGRTSSTSNRSGSFMSTAKGGKKGDKAALKPRASAVMGGVMAKTGGFELKP
ncbi:hypothetical protein QFC21_006301 [Naganishia friedmannii]|uniref:Uncharacterized protein n=1 Tax=Naganishia friedmannii TaxID=89922 RepID=A0ACC2V482_9TREE|nr:hypothetical protein QFC21_006301 [Naganishia friedmannii]